MSGLVQDPSVFGAKNVTGDSLFISKAFKFTDVESTSEDYALFAVISNDTVVCLIDVFADSNDISYQVSNWRVDELNAFCRKIPVFIDLSDRYSIGETTFQSDALATLGPLSEQTSFYTSANSYLWSFITTNAPTKGFGINQAAYKRLDMTNCGVSQGNYLCGYGAIATLYRYRTNTSVMSSAIASDFNTNICGGSYAITTSAGQAGLINTLMPVSSTNQYKVYTSGLLTQLEVMTNINNCFPIIFGGSDQLNTSGPAHAFVLHGYQMSGTNMRYYYWNPHGYDCYTEYAAAGIAHRMILYYNDGVTKREDYSESGYSVVVNHN